MTQTNRIDRIWLSGFKSIDRTELELGPLSVLIGANGAGKSNFLSMFKLLNALTRQDLQGYIGRQGGGSALLHDGPKRTPRLSLRLDFTADAGRNVYRADLTHVAPDTLIFAGEPELGLHPYAIAVLASLLREASERVHVVVSTQSALLISAIADPTTVVVVNRSGASSTLHHPDTDTMEAWLEEYTLGDIWEKGVLGGRPHSCSAWIGRIEAVGAPAA